MDRKDRQKGGLKGGSGKLKVAPSAPAEKGAPSYKTLLLATTFILFVSFSSFAIAAQTDKPLLFGIVPQQSASRLAKMWVPFLARLSEETGLDIKFATMKDIPTFEECLAQGTYDLAYMNPYHYTIYSEKAGYRAFARQKDKLLQGIIVTRIDSPEKTLQDLRNRKIALPSPAAFGASVLPRAEMKSQGIDFEPVYVKSHDSVYRSVAAGFYPAGGGVQRTFNSMPEELRSQLRIIYRTQKYTPHAFAASGNLAPERVKAILQGMLKIAQTDPELLEPIKMKGFEAATDRDWDDVRGLGLSASQTEIVEQGVVSCRFD
jgi:phosphonate transport system substrate-binding protein